MAAARLSDAQREELVSRFRSGASTQELAEAYGCSANTVIRVVKAALPTDLYEQLKRQRSRRSAGTGNPADADPGSAASSPGPVAEPLSESAPPDPEADCLSAPAAAGPLPAPDAVATPALTHPPETAVDVTAVGEPVADEADAGEPSTSDSRRPSGHEAALGLAIDDADDFDSPEDDEEDDGVDAGDEELEDGFSAGAPHGETFVEVPIAFTAALDSPLTTARPWASDAMPASAYMLVDKTVELQARPLGEIAELGRLDPAELELQALVLYSNQRQAKRLCGRNQRVIKVPDLTVFELTAPRLLQQGIRRVVLEGALYALPGT